MRNLYIIMAAILCLLVMVIPAHAAKPKASQRVQKERLVLMPLRIPEEDKNLQGAMETALVQGLQQKYEVFSGEQVAQKAREIFMKESRNTAKRDCDETRCMQNIAEAFQAELIATANVTKRDDGYFLALSVQNIFDNLVVYSNSVPCKNCDSFQVVDKLKELSGAPVQAAPPAADNSEAPIVSGKALDTEGIQWAEVQKGNSIEDFEAYLSQYPKGKYVVLAKSKIKKLKEQEIAVQAQQDQSAWDAANNTATEASYQSYLNTYPQGSYANLATARIAKLKKEFAAVEAKQKREAAEAAAKGSQPGQTFRDCPEMVVIPKGSFDMGSDNGGTDEKPVHRVTFAKPFAICKTEVTQAQWRAVMGTNPSEFSNCGDTCPVENVSWNDAKEFIQKLNTKTGKQYRLPSEAEWEYACRAGGRHEYCGSDNIDNVAWYGGSYMKPPTGNSGDKTHPVAQKQANAFGLYDMSGNVWEWVEDSWHDNYNGAPVDGSAWQGDGAMRALRGGSWNYLLLIVRSALRDGSEAAYRKDDYGFRLARTLP